MITIKEMADELGKPVDELVKLKNEKLLKGQYMGFGRNTKFTEEGARLLRLAVEAPLAVPDKLRAVVLYGARNPRWVYARIEGRDGKVPVAIPRKLRGFLDGKRIEVEAITDANGETTYRHAALGR